MLGAYRGNPLDINLVHLPNSSLICSQLTILFQMVRARDRVMTSRYSDASNVNNDLLQNYDFCF